METNQTFKTSGGETITVIYLGKNGWGCPTIHMTRSDLPGKTIAAKNDANGSPCADWRINGKPVKLMPEMVEWAEANLAAAVESDRIASDNRSASIKKQQWENRMTRARYEAECAAAGINPLPDDKCYICGLTFMSRDLELMTLRAHARTLENTSAARTPAVPAPATVKTIARITPRHETQLWEPCENCGAEPSYITPRGHLCKNCHH